MRPFGSFDFDATPSDVAAEITVQNARITELGPVLQGEIDPAPVSVTVGAPLEAGWRIADGEVWIFVLNLDDEPQSAAIVVDGVTADEAAVDDEDRTLEVEDGIVLDDFEAHELHVYRIAI
jgi:hypothetical protein